MSTYEGNGPAWFFGPGGKSQVFQPGDTIPAGYEDHPSKVSGHDVGGGTQTAVAPSNGSTSAVEAAKTKREKAPGQTDPKVSAQSGVGGAGNTPATNAPAKTDEASGANASTVELDSDGHPLDL